MKRKESESPQVQNGNKKRKVNDSTNTSQHPSQQLVESRELVCVINRSHKGEVEKHLHCRKVNDENGAFNDVRRNKKIQKILSNKQLLHVKTLISGKQHLNVIPQNFQGKGIYHKNVIDVIQNPEDFEFVKIDEDLFQWNVYDKKTKSEDGKYTGTPILTTDYSQEDLSEMKHALEADMGVIKHTIDYSVEHPQADMVPMTTHPGHHAGPNKIANYCIINNGIVAASMVKKHFANHKIGILDLDAHPGDGTKHLIHKNKKLIDHYVSLHTDEQFDNMETFHDHSKAIVFPRSKTLKGRKRNISWKEYCQKFEECLQGLSTKKLDVLIVCIGFDTLKADPIAGLEIGYQLMPNHFRKIGAMLAQQDSQIIFIQEGGYDTNLTADAFESLFQGFTVGRQFHSISMI